MAQTINIEPLQLLEDKLRKDEGRKVHHPVFYCGISQPEGPCVYIQGSGGDRIKQFQTKRRKVQRKEVSCSFQWFFLYLSFSQAPPLQVSGQIPMAAQRRIGPPSSRHQMAATSWQVGLSPLAQAGVISGS